MPSRKVTHIFNFTPLAEDGAIGHIYDFFFDDITWTVRYCVIDTGDWLPGRRVLISPQAIVKVEWETQELAFNLTQEQIQQSPDISTAKPVSLQQQIDLHEYYAWSYYWSEASYLPVYPPVFAEEENLDKENREPRAGTDPHLRSIAEVTGYHIHSTTGDIGHVEDFLVDDEDWTIRYMIVDTRNWLPGRKVLVSPQWITTIRWEEREVSVFLTKEVIKTSPEYSPETPLSPEYETQLRQHYGFTATSKKSGAAVGPDRADQQDVHP